MFVCVCVDGCFVGTSSSPPCPLPRVSKAWAAADSPRPPAHDSAGGGDGNTGGGSRDTAGGGDTGGSSRVAAEGGDTGGGSCDGQHSSRGGGGPPSGIWEEGEPPHGTLDDDDEIFSSEAFLANSASATASAANGCANFAFTRYCYYQYYMVYNIQKGGRWGIVYCPIVVQQSCNSVGNAGRGDHIRMIYSCTEALS